MSVVCVRSSIRVRSRGRGLPLAVVLAFAVVAGVGPALIASLDGGVAVDARAILNGVQQLRVEDRLARVQREVDAEAGGRGGGTREAQRETTA